MLQKIMLRHDSNNIRDDRNEAFPTPTLPQPPDIVIYRFIRNSVGEALNAGADTIQFAWRSDSVEASYRKGEAVLEEHTYPAVMRLPLKEALQDWKEMAAPRAIQIDFPDKVALVEVTAQAEMTILQMEVLAHGI